MVAGSLMLARVGSFSGSRMVPGGTMVADGRKVPGSEMTLSA